MALKALTIAMLAVAVYAFGAFAQSAGDIANGSLRDSSGVDLYGLTDEFLDDPQGFERFRHDPDNIRSVVDFLDRVAAEPHVRMLSASEQALPIVAFPGGDRFDVGYGTGQDLAGVVSTADGRRARPVKSVTVNRQAFEFYGLSIADGVPFDWNAVDPASGVLPVVLGSEYAGVYRLGSEFEGEHLSWQPMRFKVIGFLEPRAAIFSDGTLDHFLDESVVVPYPADFGPVIAAEPDYAGVLAFDRMFANLAVDAARTVDDVSASLARASDASGFTAYTVIGAPSYLVQYTLMKRVVAENGMLILVVLVLIGLAVAAECAAVNRLLGTRRAARNRILWNAGRPLRTVTAVTSMSWATEYGLALTLFAAGAMVLPFHHGSPFLATVAFMVTGFAADAVHQSVRTRAELGSNPDGVEP